VRLVLDLAVQPALFAAGLWCIAIGLLCMVLGPPLALPPDLTGSYCVGAIPGAWLDWHEYALRVSLVPIGAMLALLARAVGCREHIAGRHLRALATMPPHQAGITLEPWNERASLWIVRPVPEGAV